MGSGLTKQVANRHYARDVPLDSLDEEVLTPLGPAEPKGEYKSPRDEKGHEMVPLVRVRSAACCVEKRHRALPTGRALPTQRVPPPKQNTNLGAHAITSPLRNSSKKERERGICLVRVANLTLYMGVWVCARVLRRRERFGARRRRSTDLSSRGAPQ